MDWVLSRPGRLGVPKTTFGIPGQSVPNRDCPGKTGTVGQLAQGGSAPSPDPTPINFWKLNFVPKTLNFTIQINAYQGTKHTEVNERVFFENLSTYYKIRHLWLQRVPISFSLAELLSIPVQDILMVGVYTLADIFFLNGWLTYQNGWLTDLIG